MKKVALLAGLFIFAPMTFAQNYDIKNGLPSEAYMTCADANELASGEKYEGLLDENGKVQ